MRTSSLLGRTAAPVVAIAASWLSAAAYVITNRGFGAGDLPAMFLWSLPIGGIIAAASFVPAQIAARKGVLPLLAAYASAAILGCLLAFLWTLAAVTLLGPWVGAFSFPILICWGFGAVAGLAASASLSRPSSWPAALLVVLAAGGAGVTWVQIARRPPPTMRVIFREGTTYDEVQKWRKSVFVGPPPRSGIGHSLPPHVQSAYGADMPLDGHPTMTFTFFKRTKIEQQDSVLAALLRSSLVERIERLH